MSAIHSIVDDDAKVRRIWIKCMFLVLFSLHQPQNHLRRNAHLSNSAKAHSHILQACSQQEDFVIDDEETIMISVCQLDEFNLWILGVVFLQVSEKLLVIAGVDSC